ncbi:MAG: SDR family oxidoreductase [Planctomycetes bacterium]|nr:SDR family oxidoreductase [Planctomycetota bacterium]MBL7008230.1 SDR family oxidoreductase [Planctomycetota bacterium]
MSGGLPGALPPRPDLSGKVAIVTGASRGIGKLIARELAGCGAAVTVAAKSEQARELLPGSIHDTVAEIEAAGGRALAVRTDLRQEQEVEAMVARTVEHFGRVDILVNNAGALWWRPVAETPAKRFDLVMDVNLRASHLAAHFALAPMIERGEGGWIVNLSPPMDLGLLPGKTGYGISKLGMTMLALGLAEEVRRHGIGAFALWPATVVESQASINHQLGTPDQWRKAEVLSDALLALLSRPLTEVSGRAWLDEEALAGAGVTDLSAYSVVPGGEPLYIHGPKAAGGLWKDRAGRMGGAASKTGEMP